MRKIRNIKTTPVGSQLAVLSPSVHGQCHLPIGLLIDRFSPEWDGSRKIWGGAPRQRRRAQPQDPGGVAREVPTGRHYALPIVSRCRIRYTPGQVSIEKDPTKDQLIPTFHFFLGTEFHFLRD